MLMASTQNIKQMKKHLLLQLLFLAAFNGQSQNLPIDSGQFYQSQFFHSGFENSHIFLKAENHFLQKLNQDSLSKESNCNLYRLYYHTSAHMYRQLTDTSQSNITKFHSYPYTVQKSYADSLTKLKQKAEYYMRKCSGITTGFDFED